MSESYNIFKRLALPANGQPISLNISGGFFRCIEASTGRFEMSLDGANFFEWQKGLRLKSETGFSKVWFRILTGSGLANTIGFYYGTMDVDDSRLNVIDESSLAKVYSQEPPFTTVPIYSPSGSGIYLWSGGDAKIISGLSGAGSNLPLRSIEWMTLPKTSGLAGESILTFTMNGGIVAASFTEVPGRLMIGKAATRAGNIITSIDVTIANSLPSTNFLAYLNATYWSTPLNFQDL